MDKPEDKPVQDGGNKTPPTSAREALIDEAAKHIPKDEGWKFTDTKVFKVPSDNYTVSVGPFMAGPPPDMSTGGAVHELLMKDQEIYRLEKRIEELLKERDETSARAAKYLAMYEREDIQRKRLEHLEMVQKAKVEVVTDLFEGFLDRFLNKIN